MGAHRRSLVLLTGASGYIGGRLLKALEKAGWPVRCLARRPEFLKPKVAPSTEVAKADCLDRSSLAPAMAGVHTAYYLVHSMASAGQFEQEDRQAAQNFADAARESGIRRIIYLGGLGNQDQALSAHLRSRHEVADILRSSGIPTIEFRASIVIGSGSLSFEMIRALVQRLPVMICPRWVDVKAQPIAVEDVIDYLTEALELPAEQGSIFEIGGTDQVSYGEIMQEYARQMRPPPMDDPGSRPDAAPFEFVVGPGHSCLRSHRPQAYRQHAQLDSGARRIGIDSLWHQAERLERSDRESASS